MQPVEVVWYAKCLPTDTFRLLSRCLSPNPPLDWDHNDISNSNIDRVDGIVVDTKIAAYHL